MAHIPSKARLNFRANKANRFSIVAVNRYVYGVFEAVCADIFKWVSTKECFTNK